MIGRTLLFVAAATLMGACADTGTGTFSGGRAGTTISPFYAPSLVSYVAQDGRFPLVVRGNPFGGVPQGQLEQTLHQRLRLPGWAPDARFARDANAETGAGQRLVVVFNPAGTPDLRAVCGDVSAITLAGPANQMTIRVGFCDGPQSMTDATWRAAPAPDDSSAAFIGAVNAAVAEALPFIDRNSP